jgi:hypothetical protein
MKNVRVFVASPGDVEKERDIIRHVVDRVNWSFGDDRAINLELWRWEDRQLPGLSQDRPQTLINPELDKARIVMVILWSRIGLGTREEVERAVLNWHQDTSRRVMVYFRNAPPSSLDAASIAHYGEVRQLREALHRQHLTRDYADDRDFERLAFDHLQACVRELSVDAQGGSSRTVPDDASLRQLVEDKVADLLSRGVAFSAWNVTNAVRASNGRLEIAHDRVKDIVHDLLHAAVASGHVTSEIKRQGGQSYVNYFPTTSLSDSELAEVSVEDAILRVLRDVADTSGRFSITEQEIADAIGPAAKAWDIHRTMIDIASDGAFAGKHHFESGGRGGALFAARLRADLRRRK